MFFFIVLAPEAFLIQELPIEQVGFRRGMERARENQKYLYMCFIDYKKAFDCVDHERM